MYHRFEENKYPSTNIRINDFKSHIEMIQKNNIKFINPSNFEEELISNKKVTPICSCSKFHFYGTCNCNNKLNITLNIVNLIQ